MSGRSTADLAWYANGSHLDGHDKHNSAQGWAILNAGGGWNWLRACPGRRPGRTLTLYHQLLARSLPIPKQ